MSSIRGAEKTKIMRDKKTSKRRLRKPETELIPKQLSLVELLAMLIEAYWR
jgi:hypothetical protein